MRAYLRTYICMHCYVHTHVHINVPSGARLVRAPPTAHHASAGRVSVAAAGHSQSLQLGPVGRRWQRCELGVVRGPARQPCVSVRPVGRGRRRARAGSARPTTGNTAAAASTPRGAAQRPARHRTRSSAAPGEPAPPRTRKAAGRRRDAQELQEFALAERLGERLHLSVVDIPAAHRARVRPAPAARQWADVRSNGPKP